MRDIRVLPAVLQDITEAAAWYDGDGYPGLGDRFIATFYGYLSEIQENGSIYRTAYLDFHKVIIRPFPYSVFYRLCEDVWVVTLVTHSARRSSWTRRILRERN